MMDAGNERLKKQVDSLVNVAKQRYRQLRSELPHAITENQFVEVYLVAHRDAMEFIAFTMSQMGKDVPRL